MLVNEYESRVNWEEVEFKTELNQFGWLLIKLLIDEPYLNLNHEDQGHQTIKQLVYKLIEAFHSL